MEQGAGVSSSSLATASGLNVRRVTVLISALEEDEILARDGRKLMLRRDLRGAELTAFLGRFESQHEAERERLRSMVQYAEIAMCRMQFLREYFGEPAGERCDHCDNCRRPVAVVSENTERVTPSMAPRELHASAFTPGRTVKHRKFGSGEVLAAVNDEILVRFIRHGEKRILAARLRLVS
jgi:hypothetical protein